MEETTLFFARKAKYADSRGPSARVRKLWPYVGEQISPASLVFRDPQRRCLFLRNL
jgi:hypothetical protein